MQTARRAELPSLQGPNKEMIALQRSKLDGTLLENIETIENEMKICKDETERAELIGVMDVAKEIPKKILISTMDAAKIYKETKATLLNQEVSDYFCTIGTYEKLVKHLNVDQIYIDKKAFLVESKGTSIGEVVNHVATDVFEAIMAKITSMKSVVSLKEKHFKGSVRGHISELDLNLDKFKQMHSDLETKAATTEKTPSQQRAHVQRATEKLKKEMSKTVADGCGRKLKCEEFPELAQFIEFAFGEGDRVLRGGGGLEADR